MQDASISIERAHWGHKSLRHEVSRTWGGSSLQYAASDGISSAVTYTVVAWLYAEHPEASMLQAQDGEYDNVAMAYGDPSAVNTWQMLELQFTASATAE